MSAKAIELMSQLAEGKHDLVVSVRGHIFHDLTPSDVLKLAAKSADVKVLRIGSMYVKP